MLVEALFVNSINITDDCFLGMVCFDAGWLYKRFLAVLIGFLFHLPASFIMYVRVLYLFAADITQSPIANIDAGVVMLRYCLNNFRCYYPTWLQPVHV